MSKVKKIHHQFNYVISQSLLIGVSKRNDRKNGVDIEKNIYSIESCEKLRAFCKTFSNYIETTFPDVKYIKDIKTEHVEQFIVSKLSSWSDRTLKERLSQFEKMKILTEKTFSCSVAYDMEKVKENAQILKRYEKQNRQEKQRDKAMERNDFEKLRQALQDNEKALQAAEIARRCGLRVKEISLLRADSIDIEKRCLHVTEGAKNGKKRDVPIRDKDLQYFQNLKERNEGYIFSVQDDTLNKYIRNGLKEIGLDEKYKNTTVHSIRKLYAQERYAEEMERLHDKEKAWGVVQSELGHGTAHREELYNAYINTK